MRSDPNAHKMQQLCRRVHEPSAHVFQQSLLRHASCVPHLPASLHQVRGPATHGQPPADREPSQLSDQACFVGFCPGRRMQLRYPQPACNIQQLVDPQKQHSIGSHRFHDWLRHGAAASRQGPDSQRKSRTAYVCSISAPARRSFFPDRFSRQKSFKLGIGCWRRVEHRLKFVPLFAVHDEKSLIQQSLFGLSADSIQHEIAPRLTQQHGRTINDAERFG